MPKTLKAPSRPSPEFDLRRPLTPLRAAFYHQAAKAAGLELEALNAWGFQLVVPAQEKRPRVVVGWSRSFAGLTPFIQAHERAKRHGVILEFIPNAGYRFLRPSDDKKRAFRVVSWIQPTLVDAMALLAAHAPELKDESR